MSKITQNTTDLRAILEAVKSLPEAGGGGELQELDVTPSHEAQEFVPADGVAGYSKVTVKPVPRLPFAAVSVEEEKEIVVDHVVFFGATVSVTAEDVA